MSNLRELRVWVRDPEPLESAEVFKRLSDAIWDQREVRGRDTLRATIPVVVEPDEARDQLNEVVGAIDRRFVYSGTKRALKLKGGWSSKEEHTIPAQALASPIGVSLAVFNRDHIEGKGRDVKVNGHYQVAQFPKGQRDWHRNLQTTLAFDEDGRATPQFRYSIWRDLPTQDRLTCLDLNVHYSPLAWGGYEGHGIYSKNLSVEQELRVLELFQSLGGISLE